jgi:WD40 repeat protein
MPFRSLSADDIFISYHRAEAAYADGLAAALMERGFTCYIDRFGSEAGREVPPSLLRKVRGSRMLVVLASAGAIGSKNVRREIDEFARANGTSRIVAVYFDPQLAAGGGLATIFGLAPELESEQARASGKPSENVVNRIDRAFGYSRSKDRLRRYTLGAGGLLGLLILASVVAFLYASAQLRKANAAQLAAQAAEEVAAEQTRRAEVQEGIAAQKAREAEESAGKALAAEGARATAEGKTLLAEKATAEALRQQATAEGAARRADELARERAREAQSLDLANLSKTLRESDPTKALRVAQAAFELSPESAAAQQALYSAFYGEKHYKSFPESSPIQCIAVSPAGDRIAVGGFADKVSIREPDGTPIAEAGSGYKHVTSLAFSPDGRLLLVGNYWGGAQLYDSGGGFVRQLGDPEAKVSGVAFAPDGRSVFTADLGSGRVSRWSLENHELTSYPNDARNAQSVAVSPDGRYVAAAFFDGQVILWTADGKQVGGDMYPSGSPAGSRPARDVAFVPGKPWLLSAHEEGKVCLWGLDAKLIAGFDAHNDTVWSLAVAPDGDSFATASADVTSQIWDLPGFDKDRPDAPPRPIRAQPRAVLRGHTHWIRAVAFLRSGEVLTGGYDRLVRRWRLDLGEPRVITSGGTPINFATFSPKGDSILTNVGLDAAEFELDGRMRKTFRPPDADEVRGPVNAAAYSADGRHVLTGYHDGSLRLWSAEGEQMRRYDAGAEVTAVAFRGRTGEALAATNRRGYPKGSSRLFRWDWNSMNVSDVLADTRPINAIATTPRGDLIAIAAGEYFNSQEKALIQLSTPDGAPLKSWETGSEHPKALSFSPRGKLLLVGAEIDLGGTEAGAEASLGRSAFLLDEHRRLFRRLDGHEWRVTAGAFSADGRYVLTGSGLTNISDSERAARLWNLDGTLLFTYQAQEPVSAVSFSRGGSYFLTAEDRTVLLWQTARGIYELLLGANLDRLSGAELSTMLKSGSLTRAGRRF